MENVYHQEIVRPRCVYVRTKRSQLTHRIKEFLQNAGIKTIIAFSGSADIEESKVKVVIEEAIKKLSQFKSVAILTGGTSFGVPKIATEMGKKYGMKVIAVTPSTGIKHKLSAKLLDLRIIVEPMYDTSEWSDESSLFALLSNGVVMISGGAGTLCEAAHMFKINERRIKRQNASKIGELPDSTDKLPIFISAIPGFGGTSDLLYVLTSVFKPEVRRKSLRPEPPVNGIEAADFLIDKLNLYESEFDEV